MTSRGWIASGWLQSQREVNPRLLKVIVLDDIGAAVAATDKPVHYTIADKEYWESIYAGGRGAMNVTDLRFDEPTRSNYVGIGVPVRERSTGRFIGAVSALVTPPCGYPTASLSRQLLTGFAIPNEKQPKLSYSPSLGLV